jgi:hypothetical protein
MSAMTDYLENKWQDAQWRGVAYTPSTVAWTALFTTTTTDTGGGTEVSGGSYVRVVVSCTGSSWYATQTTTNSGVSSGSGGSISNFAVITFPAPSANWGAIGWVALYDSSTGGNMLTHGALNIAKTVNNGDPGPTFPATTFIITAA